MKFPFSIRGAFGPSRSAVAALREDRFGINASLAARKANRPALKAQARSDAAKRGWISRRAGA